MGTFLSMELHEVRKKGCGEVLVVEGAARVLPRYNPRRQPFRELLVCTAGPSSLPWRSVASYGGEASSSWGSPDTLLWGEGSGGKAAVWARRSTPQATTVYVVDRLVLCALAGAAKMPHQYFKE